MDRGRVGGAGNGDSIAAWWKPSFEEVPAETNALASIRRRKACRARRHPSIQQAGQTRRRSRKKCERSGDVFVADTGNGTIRMTTAGGVVTTLAGSAFTKLTGFFPGLETPSAVILRIAPFTCRSYRFCGALSHANSGSPIATGDCNAERAACLRSRHAPTEINSNNSCGLRI
jgi:hypothetical protein